MAAQVQAQPAVTIFVMALKQHQLVQVTVEVPQEKLVETVFVDQVKLVHPALQIVVEHLQIHAVQLIIGIVMILQAALVQVRIGAGLIVQQALARHAAAHRRGIAMIRQHAAGLVETGAGLTAASMPVLLVLQLNTGTAILNQPARA
mgnify:CR=1 FL=1